MNIKQLFRNHPGHHLGGLTKVLSLSLFTILLGLAGQLWANTVDQVVAHPAIPLLDEEGSHVLDSGKPYSSRTSCGTAGCHDYGKITHAYHMEQGRDEASDDFGALRGLPNLVSPGYYGGYNCMGGNNPDMLAKKANASAEDFADRGSAGLIQRCGSCHSGGGWAEKDRNGNRYDEVNPATVAEFDGDYYNRGTDENNQETSLDVIAQWDWQKSGVVENDCLLCHYDYRDLKLFDQLDVEGASPVYDHLYELRRKQLLEKGLFRYAGTAILELMNLNMGEDPAENRNLVTFEREFLTDGSVTPAYELTLDDDGRPVLGWNAQVFDDNGKVEIPMVRYPGSGNCMQCHRTANSRRGFYGIGEDHQGPLTADHQEDVHTGKEWTEPNGVARSIDNCNACHAKNFYAADYVNVDLDADHNFLKGNSDNDIRNDLDYNPPVRTCAYCHDDAPNPAIPSGHPDMLSAHREKWKLSSDLDGYPMDSLDRITQTHLDVVSCETCHITGKVARDTPIEPLYRYRRVENGSLKIAPFNPKPRYYWKDKNSGRVLTQTERNSVFRFQTNPDGSGYAEMVSPMTGEVLGTISARLSHGRWQPGEPTDYEGFLALKNVYDAVLASKGVADADTVLVWTEANSYLLSHNTRPAVSSVQCEDCHNRKQDGAFSSLVAPTGLLGEDNIYTITQIPDRRLVDEGIIIFDWPYMKVDDSGVVSMNVADVLYGTKLNPSLSALNAEQVETVRGQASAATLAEALERGSVSDPEGALSLQLGDNVYVFVPNHGDARLRRVALLTAKNQLTAMSFPNYQLEVQLAGGVAVDGAWEVFSLKARNVTGAEVSQFEYEVLVRLPYHGSATSAEDLQIKTSIDGQRWQGVNPANILAVQPQTAAAEGYVVFATNHFSYYAVVDTTLTTGTSSITTATDADSGGLGGSGLFMLLMGLFTVATRLWGKSLIGGRKSGC